jgi:hypothetical protein
MVTTFAKRARESAIAEGATHEVAEATTTTVTSDAKRAFANAEGMQERTREHPLTTQRHTKQDKVGALQTTIMLNISEATSDR